MAQHYSDPRREPDPHALPDVETFHISRQTAQHNQLVADNTANDDEFLPTEPGWYWWPCYPGCLPDGEATGPFATEQGAVRDAQDTYGEPYNDNPQPPEG